MHLKQTAIALCSCSNLSSSSCRPLLAPPSCGVSRLRGSNHSPPSPSSCYTSPRAREYATFHHRRDRDRDASRKSHGKNARRPCPQWPPSKEPTPYEIFNLPKNAPYNKVMFYELVKIYHPDHERHASLDGIPHTAKLERYRLIVAANNILSDPARRRLYDLYGAGWAGQSDMQNSYRTADRTWRKEPGNPSMNGTWEDWEKWHNARDGKKQEPVFMSNGGFVGVVILVMVVGGLAQATRAGSRSAALVDKRDETDSAISKNLRQRHVQSMGLTRRDRVQSFLKQREIWADDRPSGHENLWHDGHGK